MPRKVTGPLSLFPITHFLSIIITNWNELACMVYHPELFLRPIQSDTDVGVPARPALREPPDPGSLCSSLSSGCLLDMFSVLLPGKVCPQVCNGSCLILVTSVLREAFRSLSLLYLVLFFSLTFTPCWHQCSRSLSHKKGACGRGDGVVFILVHLVSGLQGAPSATSARNGWGHLARQQERVDIASLGLGTCRGRSVCGVRGSAPLCPVNTDKVQWTFKKCVYSVVILKWFCFLTRLSRLFSFPWELHYKF